MLSAVALKQNCCCNFCIRSATFLASGCFEDDASINHRIDINEEHCSTLLSEESLQYECFQIILYQMSINYCETD